MNNFRFTKIIAGVGPTLAKETVLSKVVNMVDAFTITLSMGFDDNNKKYIDTIMKLDNSKTIILETKGKDIRVKNTVNLSLQKGDKITLEYSEYAQDGDQKLYVDYAFLEDIAVGTELYFIRSKAVIRVLSTSTDALEGEVIQIPEAKIYQYDRFDFSVLEYHADMISERDQKDILRGLEYGVHTFSLSCTSSVEHYQSIKDFLAENNAKNVKVLAKIETKAGRKNLDTIATIADGIVLVIDSEIQYQDIDALKALIQKIKSQGRTVLIRQTKTLYDAQFEKEFQQLSQDLSEEVVDAYMLETFVIEDEVFPNIELAEKILAQNEIAFPEKEVIRFEEKGAFEVRDYIIFNAYRMIQEMNIKAVICFTKEGYSVARLASLAPKIPIITFTQENETYRFLSMIWGVRGYKISQSFNYENLKRIGKEMIRIIFKGNISLDDKILILQVNENNHEIKSDMINGVELYNFKNI